MVGKSVQLPFAKAPNVRLKSWLQPGRSGQLKALEKDMRHARSYQHWASLAQAHDHISGRESWRRVPQSDLFDSEQVQRRYELLRELCDSDDVEAILFALNEGIHGNTGGMGQPKLYRQSEFGTKYLISDYVNVIIESLYRVYDADESIIPFEDKLDFIRRARHCYGRSALSMSGGGGLIYFHHGVVKSLLEHDLLPNVLAGSSAGAWMCAQIGTRTDEELKGYFDGARCAGLDGLDFWKAFDVLKKDRAEAARRETVEAFCGDMTFQEAFEKTGRYINISISPAEKHQTSRLMNAITSPNVTIASAAMASSAIPGLSQPVMLEAKDAKGRLKPYLRSRRWTDGSMAQDIPTKPLSRLFGVNHMMVSMINPLAVPFVSDPKTRRESMLQSAQNIVATGSKEMINSSRRVLDILGYENATNALDQIQSLMDQIYTGHVNIMLDQKDFRWINAAFVFKNDAEIRRLIRVGERATWPKIEMIRNASAISRELDDLGERLERRDMEERHQPSRAHMTLP